MAVIVVVVVVAVVAAAAVVNAPLVIAAVQAGITVECLVPWNLDAIE